MNAPKLDPPPTSRNATRQTAWMLFLIAVLIHGSGCGTAKFYTQALRGQWQMLTAPQPIRPMLIAPSTRPELKSKLALVLRLREFAEHELALPTDGHYLNYADLGRPFAVWTVHATPEFSLEEKTWWYPIVGRLKYRGFFTHAGAQETATELAKQHFDVYVGGVEAYSTLGWFHDPVLNTFIGRNEPELAELLFHELAHQRVFVAGDTDFNEAFATAVSQAGVRRWLRAKGDTDALAKYEESLQHEKEFVKLVLATRTRLTALYKEKDRQSPEDLRRHKAALLEQLHLDYTQQKRQWGHGVDEYEQWFTRPLNNARLNTIATYHDLLPGFEQLLAAQNGDLEKFFHEVKHLGNLPKKERRDRLLSLTSH